VGHLEQDLTSILSVLTPSTTAPATRGAYHSYVRSTSSPARDAGSRARRDTAASIPWFTQTVLYDIYSDLPGGDDNYGGVANFGDCPPRTTTRPAPSRLARAAARDGLAQWSATTLDWPYLLAVLSMARSERSRVEPGRSAHLTAVPLQGIFAWRSSWANDATYLSIKSGAYWGGHEHPDAGHFILHRAGVPTSPTTATRTERTRRAQLLVVDGLATGRGEQWMNAVDRRIGPGSIRRSGSAYFDVLADPPP